MATRGTPAFTDPDDLERRIEEYFESLEIWADKVQFRTDAEGNEIREVLPHLVKIRPPTMAGLALALDVDRTTLINYRGKDQFQPVLARAKQRIATWVEEALFNREMSNGAKFALEVNHGYGKEDNTPTNPEAFEMKTIMPAPPEQAKAIPKWEPQIDEDSP